MTQRVVDQPGDCRAIARSGEAVVQAPILEDVGRGPAARFDVGKHFHGGRQTGGWGHANTSLMTIRTHMTIRMVAPARKMRKRLDTSLAPV